MTNRRSIGEHAARERKLASPNMELFPVNSVNAILNFLVAKLRLHETKTKERASKAVDIDMALPVPLLSDSAERVNV